MANPNKIVAIVVAYYPNLHGFKKLLEATSTQVDQIVVVDNTPKPNPDLMVCCPKLNNLNLISLGDNFGIAYAHNKGIEWASYAWAITEYQASKLVGGDIYLHKGQDKPSYFGGKILSYFVLGEDAGEDAGRVVFVFQASQEHKGFKAGHWLVYATPYGK